MRVLKGSEGPGQHLEIVGVADTGYVPPVADETGGHVFGESQSGVAFDGDAVVVVNPAEIGQAQVAGEGRGLAGDAFHHASISAKCIDIEVEQFEGGPVVSRGKPLPRNGHADAGRHALAERSGCGLDAGCPAIFGVAGTAAIQLAE